MLLSVLICFYGKKISVSESLRSARSSFLLFSIKKENRQRLYNLLSIFILKLIKKSKNLFFSSDVTVFSLHEQHDASLNFWFRTHIILAKNVPWHILTLSAVACDMFLLRASAHHWHVSAFLCNREFQEISYYTKNRRTFLYNGLLYIPSKLHTEFLLLLSFILLGNNFLLPILNHNLLVKPSTD